MTALVYPFYVAKFWYGEGLLHLLHFYSDLNHYLAEFFSLPLLLKSFFAPLKNEYRGRQLVIFSRLMGMALKTVFIGISFSFLILAFVTQILFAVLYLLFPVAPFYLLLV